MFIPSKGRSSVMDRLKKHQDAEREVALGKRGIVYQDNPRHVDLLVKDLGIELGHSVQTLATT